MSNFKVYFVVSPQEKPKNEIFWPQMIGKILSCAERSQETFLENIFNKEVQFFKTRSIIALEKKFLQFVWSRRVQSGRVVLLVSILYEYSISITGK